MNLPPAAAPLGRIDAAVQLLRPFISGVVTVAAYGFLVTRHTLSQPLSEPYTATDGSLVTATALRSARANQKHAYRHFGASLGLALASGVLLLLFERQFRTYYNRGMGVPSITEFLGGILVPLTVLCMTLFLASAFSETAKVAVELAWEGASMYADMAAWFNIGLGMLWAGALSVLFLA